MEASLDRGNCLLCGQRRVLGCLLPSDGGQEAEFRCCACIDEHGAAARASAEPLDESEPPRNWWASIEPPASLLDVPAGFLEAEHIPVWGGCFQDWILAVSDPCHNYFTGHGAERVWPAALALASFLLSRPCAGMRVVELGAGCGLPGLAMARQGAAVTLTDVPWMLQLAAYNAEANFAPEDALLPPTAPLRWGSEADAAALLAARGVPDLVIGADVVYRSQDFEPLLASISSLGAREVLLAVVHRDSVLRDFMKKLELLDWEVELCSSGPPPLQIGGVLILRLRPLSSQSGAAPAAAMAGLLPAKGLGGGNGEQGVQGGAEPFCGRWPTCQAALAKGGAEGGCWGAVA